MIRRNFVAGDIDFVAFLMVMLMYLVTIVLRMTMPVKFVNAKFSDNKWQLDNETKIF